MTQRQKELYKVLKTLGKARPRAIGEIVGFTSDHMEQLCQDMVRKKYFIKLGRYYAVAPEGHYARLGYSPPREPT